MAERSRESSKGSIPGREKSGLPGKTSHPFPVALSNGESLISQGKDHLALRTRGRYESVTTRGGRKGEIGGRKLLQGVDKASTKEECIGRGKANHSL